MTEHCDVAIVGGGPVGATAALLLAAHGVESVVLERRVSPQTHPAAHVLSTRSLEIWREVGIEREIRRISAPLEELRSIVYCTTLAGQELGRVALSDLPPARLDSIESVSPTRLAHLPQSVLEPLLWTQLDECDRIDFRRGCTYVGHTVDPGGVRLAVDDGNTVGPQTISARFVIGADGASSAVRHALGLTMDGPVLQHVVSVHFSANLERYLRNRRGPVIWTHTARGLGTFIVHRPPTDLVFQIPYFPPFQRLSDFSASVCRDHIVDAIGDPGVDVQINSVQSWAMTAQVASGYRGKAVFLAGDSAHRFPPMGGLGLNTGVADVHNLAWKIAWVLRGRAGEALLDTYEQERRPIGLAATADSVANFDGMLDVLDALGLPRRAVRALPAIVAAVPTWIPRKWGRTVLRSVTALGYTPLRVAASSNALGRRKRRRAADAIAHQGPHYRSWARDLGVIYAGTDGGAAGFRIAADDREFYTPRIAAGGRLPHAWLNAGRTRISTLDLPAEDELTLLTGPSAAPRWSDAAARLPVRVEVMAREWAALCGAAASQAEPDGLLVRPDGHIAAVLTPHCEAAATLQQALDALDVRPAGRRSWR